MISEIAEHLERSLPNEGCGLLAVSGPANEPRAERFFPGTNLDQSPDRFTMDPLEVLKALEAIDQSGWRLGVIVHSHPSGPNTPSSTDRSEARYLDAIMLIAGWESGIVSLCAWELEGPHRQHRMVHIVNSPERAHVDRTTPRHHPEPQILGLRRSERDMSTEMGADSGTMHAALQRDLQLFPDELSRMVGSIPRDQLRRAASDGGWGAVEVLSHLRDRERLYLEQAALILAEHDPLLPAPDDTLWEIERSYRTQDPDVVLAEFATLRREFTKLLTALPLESWNRTGRHPQLGTLTLTAIAERARDHDRVHATQIRDSLA